MDPNPSQDPAYSPSTCPVAVVLVLTSLLGSSAVVVAAVEPPHAQHTLHLGMALVHPRPLGLDPAARPVCLHRTLVLYKRICQYGSVLYKSSLAIKSRSSVKAYRVVGDDSDTAVSGRTARQHCSHRQHRPPSSPFEVAAGA